MTDTLEIVINLDDIANGIRVWSRGCAAAQALIRTGHTNVVVLGKLVLADGREWLGPPELAEWVWAFDRGDPVAPERFVCRVTSVTALRDMSRSELVAA